MGWIKVDRGLMNNWIWKSREPFDKRSAWIDLLMMASYTDEKVEHNGKIIENKRGVVNRSLSYLAERWHWDRRKVKRLMSVLALDGMVSVNSTTQGTTITIENYDVYQSEVKTNSTTIAQRLHNDCTTDGTQYKKKIREEEKEDYYSSLLADEHKRFVEFRRARGLPVIDDVEEG